MQSFDAIDSVLRLKGHEVWSVSPIATVFEAIQKMSDLGVGALLVISQGRLAGILSERDYARKVILKNRSSQHTLVREIMTSPVITATLEDKVEECMLLMTKHRIRHLPVMDGDEIVGVVSIGDLVNWIINAREETIEQLEGYIVGKYPG